MPCPKRLLLADLRSDGLRDVFRPLEALGVEIIVTGTLEATHEALEAHDFEVLVLDPRKLVGDELDLGLVDRSRQGGATPVLLVADPSDPIPAVIAGRALRGGPWDLVHRDAPPEEILLRTERLIEHARTLIDLHRAKYQASHDERTGLLRAGPFDDRLREHFSAAQRHRLELALVLVDLDDFGAVNKRFDHTVGDDLIARAGGVVRMSLRAEDVGARIGGDEFAMILPYTQRVDAARVVSRLASRFRALSGPPPLAFRGPHHGEGSASIRVSASLGFETFDGGDLATVDDLRGRAERALHDAKKRGGNQGVYYRNMADS